MKRITEESELMIVENDLSNAPLHSLFWKVRLFDQSLGVLYIRSNRLCTSKLPISDHYKSLICPFYLNDICK